MNNQEFDNEDNQKNLKEKEELLDNILKELNDLKLLQGYDTFKEKEKVLLSIKETFGEELNISKKKIFYSTTIDNDIDIFEKKIKKYKITLHEGKIQKKSWYTSDKNQLALTLVTYIGTFFTIFGLILALTQISTVNKELNKQWDTVNKKNLQERYLRLLEDSQYITLYASIDNIEDLLSYINQSNAYLRNNQKRKYKKFYKQKFEAAIPEANKRLTYYTKIRREEYINCLKDMQLQLKE